VTKEWNKNTEKDKEIKNKEEGKKYRVLVVYTFGSSWNVYMGINWKKPNLPFRYRTRRCDAANAEARHRTRF